MTTTAAADLDCTAARLTNPENADRENRECLIRLESKVDGLTAAVADSTITVQELTRRIDRLFYLSLATGAGIIAAILLQPLVGGG